jgi:hypothetical protein
MKGIELPINALVIIIIAVLVLLGIAALWMSGWGGGSQGVTVEAAKAAACSALMRNYAGCSAIFPKDITISNFDANMNGATGAAEATTNFNNGALPSCNSATLPAQNGDNLQTLCYCYYNTKTIATAVADCRKLCGCGG